MNSNPQPSSVKTTEGRPTPAKQGYALAAELLERAENMREHAQANARLIAAAPDLLAACKAALKALEPEQGEWNDIRNQLRQTIAKAGYK